MAELLPVLEPRPFLEGSAGLFRAIHTQLCEGGRHFPVLVSDELLDSAGEPPTSPAQSQRQL